MPITTATATATSTAAAALGVHQAEIADLKNRNSLPSTRLHNRRTIASFEMHFIISPWNIRGNQ